jgi:hypothetical protein
VEYARAIIATTERLRVARRLEPALIDDLQAELDALRDRLARGPDGALEKAITAYHRRRARLVPRLVAMIQRQADARRAQEQ